MKFLILIFGLHGVVLGKGKVSNLHLSQDQSVDNMLDTYAKEIIPNFFILPLMMPSLIAVFMQKLWVIYIKRILHSIT